VPSVEPASDIDPVARCERLAHQVYFELPQWESALTAWRLRAAIAAPNVETQLALAHCQIELAAEHDLSGIVLDQPVALSNGNRDLYLYFVQCRAYALLQQGDAARAAQLTRLMAAVDRHLNEVYARQILPAGGAADIPQPVDAPLPFQQEFDLDDASAHAVIERHRHRRVLLVLRGASSGAILACVRRHFATSLAELAIACDGYDVNPGAEVPRPLFIDGLRQAIAGFGPDVVVYEDMFVSGPAAELESWNRIVDVLETARRSRGTKIVFSYSDAWYDGMADMMNAAYHVPDLFHMFHPALLARLVPAAAEKTFCYPSPVTDPRDRPAPPGPARRRSAFVGTTGWAAPSRLVWWTEMAKAGLPVDLFSSIETERSPSEYAALLADYAIGVNFTTRCNGETIWTGRSGEIPLYGSLLLEEASTATSWFLRPFEHYVPFATLAELEARLRRLLDDAPLRDRITRAGTAWTRRYFSGLHFWARLFRRLYEVESRPAAPPRSGKPIHVSVPAAPPSVLQYQQRGATSP
jgi:hypothetical protein